MPLFQRSPGPWKRYTDAAGGSADAGGLFDHILLRFRTNDTLVERGGKRWIAQAMRCWRQEVPLSDRRLDEAIHRLERCGLIETGVWRISDTSPTRYTYITLTEYGETFLASQKDRTAGSKRLDRHSQGGQAGSVTVDETARPTEGQELLCTTSLKETDSKLSLAPSDAKEKQDDDQRGKTGRGKSREGRREKSGPAKRISDIWHDVMRENGLPCSEFSGPVWNYARHVGEGLGDNAEEVIRAAISEWQAFRCYLVNERRVSTCSTEPDFMAFAHYIDQAQAWLVRREREVRERAKAERCEYERRATREAECAAQERKYREVRYHELVALEPKIRAELAQKETKLQEELDDYDANEQEKQGYKAWEENRSGTNDLRKKLEELVELKGEFGDTSATAIADAEPA